MKKFIEFIWQLIISISNAKLEVPSLLHREMYLNKTGATKLNS